MRYAHNAIITQIAQFTGPTWGPPGSYRPQMGPTLAPCNLLSGKDCVHDKMYKRWSTESVWSIYRKRDISPTIFHSSMSAFIMMTSSNGNIFRVAGPLCGEFTGPGEFTAQRPVTRSFDVFFDLRLNKRLSKQLWGWWFETPSWSLWRQYNDQTLRAWWHEHLATIR